MPGNSVNGRLAAKQCQQIFIQTIALPHTTSTCSTFVPEGRGIPNFPAFTLHCCWLNSQVVQTCVGEDLIVAGTRNLPLCLNVHF